MIGQSHAVTSTVLPDGVWPQKTTWCLRQSPFPFLWIQTLILFGVATSPTENNQFPISFTLRGGHTPHFWPMRKMWQSLEIISPHSVSSKRQIPAKKQTYALTSMSFSLLWSWKTEVRPGGTAAIITMRHEHDDEGPHVKDGLREDGKSSIPVITMKLP